MGRPVLYFDLETHAFGPGVMAAKPVCIAWQVIDGDRPVGQPELALASEIDRILGPWLDRAAAGEAIVAAHHTAYDMRSLLAWHKRLEDPIWDAYWANGVGCSQIRERLLHCALGQRHKVALDECAERRLGMKLDKGADSFRTRYGSLDGTPLHLWPAKAREYPLDDVRAGVGVIIHQANQAAAMHYPMGAQYDEARADLVLALAQAWGIGVDREAVERYSAGVRAKMAALSQQLWTAKILRLAAPERRTLFGETVPAEYSTNDTRVRELVKATWPADRLGEVPTTPGGKVAADGDTIEDCEHPDLNAYSEYKALEKLLGFVSGLAAREHPSYHVLGANSERTSASGPNIQQLPREPGPRECFVPDPGWALLNCDFNSQEVRTLAQACLEILGRSRMAEKYQADPDWDPHTEFAAGQFLGGISYEEALERVARKDKAAKDGRQTAKIGNFGIPGGMGVNGLIRFARVYGQRWNKGRAQEVQDLYFRQWPEMRGYFNWVRSVVGEGGWGRFDVYGFWRGGCGFTDGANTGFQTRAARASKRALAEVGRRCYDRRMRSPLHGCRPWLFMHDEVGVQAPIVRVAECGPELERVMVDAMQAVIKDVPARASATAMDRWSKNAAQVYGPDGGLAVWSPKREAT